MYAITADRTVGAEELTRSGTPVRRVDGRLQTLLPLSLVQWTAVRGQRTLVAMELVCVLDDQRGYKRTTMLSWLLDEL